MRRAQIGVFLMCVLGVVALGWGRNRPNDPNQEGGTLIRHASIVLTMDPSLGRGLLGQLENADVLIVGDRIATVGKLGKPPKGVRVIDGRGMIVMPGFVDTHDHLWQSVIRGCATDENVSGWFPRCGLPLAQHFRQADAYAAVRLSTTGLIDTGVTTVTDWSHAFNAGFLRGNLDALNDSGLRYVFAMIGNTPDGSDIKAAKAEFIDPNPLGTLQVAGRVRLDVLRSQVTIARELGVKLHVHLLENPAERLNGNDPIKILEVEGALALGGDLLAAHVIHVSPPEIAKLAGYGTVVSHQPLSNMRLASGVIHYAEMKNAGIRIGLGLDGGTNDTTDTFNNMRAATGLQRARAIDPKVSPTVDEVLRAATLGGAEVLGLESTIGSLTPGKQADVIVIDTNMLNFAPVLKPVAQLVFNGQSQNVKWVFVAGRALKEDGTLTGVNEREVIEAAQRAADHLKRLLDP